MLQQISTGSPFPCKKGLQFLRNHKGHIATGINNSFATSKFIAFVFICKKNGCVLNIQGMDEFSV